jgi:hypothetical protein
LKTCKVGDCKVKLSADALARIQKETDWAKPTASADVDAKDAKSASRRCGF